MPPTCRSRRAAIAAVIGGLVAVGAGCRRPRTDDGAVLDRVPAAAAVVVMVRPGPLAATWAAPLAVALARRLAVPACVVARARAASRIVIAWRPTDGDDGWLIAIAGGGDAPCPDLVGRGGIATWSRQLPARASGDPGFFADRALRARWARLPGHPIRGLAEHELSAGIIAHASFSLDPIDGVAADATVRFDAPDAAAGARARLERWRADLDPARMGGAWPAVAALDVAGPEPGAAELTLRLRLPGAVGATAAPLLATALTLGADRADRLPCPLDPGAAWGLTCHGGELRVPRAVRDDLIAHADVHFAADRVVTTTSAGAITGLRLTTVGAGSPLRALGLREGDWLQAVDEVPITSVDQLAAWARAVDAGATVTLVRAGRVRSIRFKLP